MITLLYRRLDGTFVADVGGNPYHVIPSDEMYWDAAVAEAAHMGDALTYEPSLTDTLPGPRVIYKADIWRRATDDEAVTMDTMLNSQSVRLRRMWADAVNLSEDDELFPVIHAALAAEFGEERAEELLA